MRVSIIVPPFDYGANLYGLVRRRSFHNAVPLGAISVAAYLRKAGHKVQVVDAPAQNIGDEGICAEVNRFVPDAIGIGATSLIYPSASRLAPLLRDRFGVPLFIGGPHASLYPEWVLEENEAWDIVVHGEGEETSVELIDRLDKGLPLDGLTGAMWRGASGEPVSGGDRIAKMHLDDAPRDGAQWPA